MPKVTDKNKINIITSAKRGITEMIYESHADDGWEISTIDNVSFFVKVPVADSRYKRWYIVRVSESR